MSCVLPLSTSRPANTRTRRVRTTGVIVSAIGVATAVHYALTARRIRHLESLARRIVCAEHDVIDALQRREATREQLLD